MLHAVGKQQGWRRGLADKMLGQRCCGQPIIRVKRTLTGGAIEYRRHRGQRGQVIHGGCSHGCGRAIPVFTSTCRVRNRHTDRYSTGDPTTQGCNGNRVCESPGWGEHRSPWHASSGQMCLNRKHRNARIGCSRHFDVYRLRIRPWSAKPAHRCAGALVCVNTSPLVLTTAGTRQALRPGGAAEARRCGIALPAALCPRLSLLPEDRGGMAPTGLPCEISHDTRRQGHVKIWKLCSSAQRRAAPGDRLGPAQCNLDRCAFPRVEWTGWKETPAVSRSEAERSQPTQWLEGKAMPVAGRLQEGHAECKHTAPA